MKRMFRSLFDGRWKFHRAALTESTQELRNPARGWYRIHTFLAQERFSARELEWCMEDSSGSAETLALVLIDIGEYRERRLDGSCLSNIEAVLKFFAGWQRDMILRIVYDHEGRAQEREPFLFAQVTEHLEQLGPLLARYAEYIYVYQGMLVGNWGEMHTSRFLSAEKLTKLSSLLRGYLGEETFLAVRRPVQWRTLHPSACGNRDLSGTRMGLFDDAVFGSETHMGTFGTKPEAEMGWDEPWAAEDELAFEEELCRYAPQGGEVVYEEREEGERPLEESVERLRRMQVSYLNSAHDERLLGVWKKMTWQGAAPWGGLNGYDYIGRHLGYRFCVRRASAVFPQTGREECLWEIAVENTGFARCYQETLCWLEWRDGAGQTVRRETDLELHRILPGRTGTGRCVCPPAEGGVYLYAVRKRDGAPIFFANETGGKRGVLLGRLAPG